MLVSVHNTLTYVCRYLCSSEEEFVHKGWICWRFLDQWLALSWEDTTQSRTPAQELMFPAGTRQRFSTSTSVTHLCQNYSTESCISKHSIGVKIQILDGFPSSPGHCFLSRTLRRQLEHGSLVDLHAVDYINTQAKICDYTDAESISSGMHWLRKTASRLKQAARINACSKSTGWCIRKLPSLWIRCICF